MDLPVEFKVSVHCNTYNHAPYILDAMNGFCMQQTCFPFVCIIIDDFSTDGEQDVITEYLNEYFNLCDNTTFFREETNDYVLLFARHKSNINCYFAVYLLKYNHYSIRRSKTPYQKKFEEDCKYIALCEGDDYWIIPNKLKKQVCFMDLHPDFTLCGTNCIISWEYGEHDAAYFNKIFKSKELKPEDIFERWSMPTASLLFRKEVLDNYPDWSNKIYSGDQTLILVSMYRGRIYCFGLLSCIYRKSTTNNASLSNNIDLINMWKQHKMLYNFYNLWTNKTYDSLIQKKLAIIDSNIILKEKDNKYNRLKRKSIILSFFLMPVYSLKKYTRKSLKRVFQLFTFLL